MGGAQHGAGAGVTQVLTASCHLHLAEQEAPCYHNEELSRADGAGTRSTVTWASKERGLTAASFVAQLPRRLIWYIHGDCVRLCPNPAFKKQVLFARESLMGSTFLR